MFGQNPIRPPETHDGSTLQVVQIFPTLQGEGPFVGYPAVFVRLGGCNLACDFCDTEFEDFRAMAVDAVVAQVKAEAGEVRKLVVMTGGEPLRQNIVPLCEALLEAGFTVQIETNGSLWRPLPPQVHIVCSPKVKNGRYHPLRPDVLARVHALKFLISATHPDYRDVGDVGQGDATPIYVQAMDEYDAAKNAANLSHAAMLAHSRGYRLSLQLHKIVGME